MTTDTGTSATRPMLPAPQTDAGATAAPPSPLRQRWLAALGGGVLTLWVVALVVAWQNPIWPATMRELVDGARSGQVSTYFLTTDESHADGFGLAWAEPTVFVPTPGEESEPGAGPDTVANATIVWRSVDGRWRVSSLGRDLGAGPDTSGPSTTGTEAVAALRKGGARLLQPGDGGTVPIWPGRLLGVICLGLVVLGPAPRVGSRWFWFWLVGGCGAARHPRLCRGRARRHSGPAAASRWPPA